MEKEIVQLQSRIVAAEEEVDKELEPYKRRAAQAEESIRKYQTEYADLKRDHEKVRQRFRKSPSKISHRKSSFCEIWNFQEKD